MDTQGARAGPEARGAASGGSGLQDEDLLRHGQPAAVPGGLPALFAPCWLLLPLAVQKIDLFMCHPNVRALILRCLIHNCALAFELDALHERDLHPFQLYYS